MYPDSIPRMREQAGDLFVGLRACVCVCARACVCVRVCQNNMAARHIDPAGMSRHVESCPPPDESRCPVRSSNCQTSALVSSPILTSSRTPSVLLPPPSLPALSRPSLTSLPSLLCTPPRAPHTHSPPHLSHSHFFFFLHLPVPRKQMVLLSRFFSSSSLCSPPAPLKTHPTLSKPPSLLPSCPLFIQHHSTWANRSCSLL